MKYLFTIHPEARQEVLDAIAYLAEQREGYGDLFNLRVDEAISKILEHPTRYQAVSRQQGRYRVYWESRFTEATASTMISMGKWCGLFRCFSIAGMKRYGGSGNR